jgi:ABC-2 type transport system ATP-binding protein
MKNAVEIKNLRKEYSEFILENIYLDIPAGYITGIIGPNGAGKTTTIKLIMGLISRDKGDVEVLGLDNLLNEIEIKNRVGYIGEEQYFYELHSACWTGNFVSHFYKNWDADKFDNLLKKFELPLKKRIKNYSKGMKVKLSLAIAFSHEPEIIILDEPTSGLDPVIRREILDYLQEFTQSGRTVIISSHITDDITRIADYVAYMIQGKIRLFESKDTLLSDWKRIHIKKAALNQEIITDLENIEKHMFGISGVTKNYFKIKDKLSEGLSSGDIKIENVGLDDILISLVGGG